MKMLCKLAVEKSQKTLTKEDKEMLKQGIDQSKNIEDLLLVALSSLMIQE